MATRKKSNMKGITIGSGNKRPTKQGAGMTKKGVAKYRRQNPGSKLQTAVTANMYKAKYSGALNLRAKSATNGPKIIKPTTAIVPAM